MSQDPKWPWLTLGPKADGSEVPADEPVVVLRGKDEFALAAIRAYIASQRWVRFDCARPRRLPCRLSPA